MTKIANTIRRKCNRYLTSIPIEERIHAGSLASEVCWDIIDVLRESGFQGMSAEEIRHRLKIKRYPKSTIYAALSQLEKAQWITGSRPTFPWGRPPKEIEIKSGRDKAKGGRPRKLYRVHILWEFDMDDVFAESLDPIVKKHITELKENWIRTLKNIVEEYKTEKNLQKFYPKDIVCPDCGISHEALEFLRAISYGVVHFMETEKEWEEFTKKHGFTK